VTTLVEVWTSTCETQQECDWATAAAALSNASIIAPRFGASDCQCASHLFYFTLRPETGEFEALVQVELARERLGEQTGCIGQGA
jgi:Uri superfamily endonuclease